MGRTTNNVMKYHEFAHDLFDELQSAYPEFSWWNYITDDENRYEKSFEEILLKKLKSCWNSLTRNDLDKIAEGFQKIAENEGSELFFPERIYECVEGVIDKKKYTDKDEIRQLSKFLAIDLEYIANTNTENSSEEPNFLFLSFDTDPNPFKDEKIVDGKGEALLRAITEKNKLECSSVTLLYENKVKEFFITKEIKNVNWIRSYDDVNEIKNNVFDFIFLVNPELCQFNIQFTDDYTEYIVEGIKGFQPLSQTLDKYGKALKPGGYCFFIIEDIAVDYELIQQIQGEALANKLHMETVIDFYSFKPVVGISETGAGSRKSSNLSVIILRKKVTETGYIKFLNVDCSMDDGYLEELIRAGYPERLKYKSNMAFFPKQMSFSDVSDFKEQSDKIYYSLLERYYQFFYQGGANANYIKLAKKLYDVKYADDVKALVTKRDWMYINDLAKTAESLGLYYVGYQDLIHLRKAKKFLEIALWCRMDISSAFEMAKEKIAMLESGQSPFTKIKMQFMALCPIDLSANNRYAMLSDIEQILKDVFGNKYWNKLQKETRIYIQTAVFSFLQFLDGNEQSFEKFDYSGVISLLMRALELELKKRFCLDYIQFLKERYPNPFSYLKVNCLTFKISKNSNDVKGIVKYARDENPSGLRYISYDGSNIEDGSYYFSLGKINKFTGFKEDTGTNGPIIRVDSTFLEYLSLKMNGCYKRANCENQRERFEREKKIKHWVSKISKDIESLRVIRNNASHGGTILNIEAAMQSFNSLILVRKVLKELVTLF